jgi:hypothetical protein
MYGNVIRKQGFFKLAGSKTCFPSMYKALDSIPSTKKRKRKKASRAG